MYMNYILIDQVKSCKDFEDLQAVESGLKAYEFNSIKDCKDFLNNLKNSAHNEN